MVAGQMTHLAVSGAGTQFTMENVKALATRSSKKMELFSMKSLFMMN